MLTHRIAGRYQVLRQLGQGATATVLLVADERRDGVLLALKLLRRTIDAQYLRQEYDILAGLRHAHLVNIFDLELGPSPFATYEYVEGPPLRQWSLDQDRGPLLRALVGILVLVGPPEQPSSLMLAGPNGPRPSVRPVTPCSLLAKSSPRPIISAVFSFGAWPRRTRRAYWPRPS